MCYLQYKERGHRIQMELKFNGTQKLLVYAEDVNLFEASIYNLKSRSLSSNKNVIL
jgi:hypothetical protein